MAKEVPIAEKSLLTPEEAAAYLNIGVNKIRMMTDSPSCPYVLWSGSRRLAYSYRKIYSCIRPLTHTNGIKNIIQSILAVSSSSLFSMLR